MIPNKTRHYFQSSQCIIRKRVQEYRMSIGLTPKIATIESAIKECFKPLIYSKVSENRYIFVKYNDSEEKFFI